MSAEGPSWQLGDVYCRCGRLTSGCDWAHGVWEALAATLAEPLRRALDDHLNAHLCGTGDHLSPHYIGGFFNCPEAKSLFELLPDGDRVLLG